MFGEDFFLGFLFGAIAVSIFGYISNAIKKDQKAMNAPGKPQMVSVPTKKTPAQVVAEARMATLRLGLWIVFLIAAIGVIILTFY